jgi:hypothetical protein
VRLPALALSAPLVGLPAGSQAAVLYEIVGRKGVAFTFRWTAPDFLTFPTDYSYEVLPGATQCLINGSPCPDLLYAATSPVIDPLFGQEVRISTQVGSTGWGGAFKRLDFLTLGSHGEMFRRNATLNVASAPTSVPEPAGLAVLAAGLLALGTLRLRRWQALNLRDPAPR